MSSRPGFPANTIWTYLAIDVIVCVVVWNIRICAGRKKNVKKQNKTENVHTLALCSQKTGPSIQVAKYSGANHLGNILQHLLCHYRRARLLLSSGYNVIEGIVL